MPAETKLVLDYAAIGLLLRESPEMRAHLEEMGRKGVAYAQSIAPVGTRSTKYTTPGQYRESIRMEITVTKTRMVLTVLSDDYTAWWIEYGSKKVERRAVLRRTLDYLATGHSAAPLTYGGAAAYDAANRGTQKRRAANRRSRVVRAGLKGT